MGCDARYSIHELVYPPAFSTNHECQDFRVSVRHLLHIPGRMYRVVESKGSVEGGRVLDLVEAEDDLLLQYVCK